jgi:hypothetical protein
MFLGIADPYPDPLVTSSAPAPDQAKDPSIIKKKPCFLLFCNFFVTFCSVPDPQPDLDPYVFGHPGSASGSVNQRYGSEDPDPYQNVTDPQY